MALPPLSPSVSQLAVTGGREEREISGLTATPTSQYQSQVLKVSKYRKKGPSRFYVVFHEETMIFFLIVQSLTLAVEVSGNTLKSDQKNLKCQFKEFSMCDWVEHLFKS